MRRWMEQLDERLGRIEADLNEHMRRSLANEEANEHTRQQIDLLRQELAPLKTHVAAWGGVAKAVTIMGSLGGAAVAIAKLFGKI